MAEMKVKIPWMLTAKVRDNITVEVEGVQMPLDKFFELRDADKLPEPFNRLTHVQQMCLNEVISENCLTLIMDRMGGQKFNLDCDMEVE